MYEAGRWWPRVSSAGVLSVLAVATFVGLRPTPPVAVAARAAWTPAPVAAPVSQPVAGAILAPYSARQDIASRGDVAYAMAGGALTLEDIPVPSLVAYQRAASVIDTADAKCNLDWELLAALGKVLSDHGRAGGAQVDDQGVSRPAVLGDRLTGRHGTQRVADTDRGKLDRDRHLDRAVGPLLMLPAVWSVVAVDGDADGRRNPQDVDDAALAAAVFLCAGPGDFHNASHVRSEVKRYHSGTDYAKNVLGVRAAYADAGSLPTTVSLLAREEGVAPEVTAVEPLPTADPTYSGEPSFEPGPSMSSPTASAGPTAGPVPTPSPTATASPTTSGSAEPTPTPTDEPSPSASDDPSPTDEPSATDEPSPTDSESPTSSPTPTEPPSSGPVESPGGTTAGPATAALILAPGLALLGWRRRRTRPSRDVG